MKKVAARDPGELARLWKGCAAARSPTASAPSAWPTCPPTPTRSPPSRTPRSKYDSATTGGPWYKGVRNQCRPKIYTHNEDFYYYYLSFRCCAEADGKPTDPRTPRPIKDGWKFGKVEKSAQFTVTQMQDLLKLKEQNGKCGCKDRDILCKTMCGSLLGPSAVDATH